jgi:hypothetical protein
MNNNEEIYTLIMPEQLGEYKQEYSDLIDELDEENGRVMADEILDILYTVYISPNY